MQSSRLQSKSKQKSVTTRQRYFPNVRPVLLARRERGFWNDLANVKDFLDDVAKSENIKHPHDWAMVTTDQIKFKGGRTLLDKYGSLLKILKRVYPDQRWDSLSMQEYWSDIANQRTFMLQLGQKLGVKQLCDWKRVTLQQLKSNGGSTLVKLYKGSRLKLFQSVYPDHKWQAFDLSRVPNYYWRNISNQRKFMDELGKILNIKQLSDWNSITAIQIQEYGGQGLLALYNHSPFQLLKTIYPEYEWQATDRSYVPCVYWEDKTNQRIFMDRLGQKLNLTHLQDWNTISLDKIQRNGGGGLLARYKFSRIELLRNIYPEHKWTVTDFVKVPKHYFESKLNQREFMDKLAKKLNIKEMNDWSMITAAHIRCNGGGSLVNLYGGNPLKLLQSVYPEYDWRNFNDISYGTSKTQVYLKALLASMVSHETMLNFKHPDAMYKAPAHRKVEFDVFCPSLALAIEYQGEPHYFDAFIFSSSTRRSQVDKWKYELALSKGITLISIPFWWDKATESLAATIQSIRPDIQLSVSGGVPVSQQMPQKVLDRVNKRIIT